MIKEKPVTMFSIMITTKSKKKNKNKKTLSLLPQWILETIFTKLKSYIIQNGDQKTKKPQGLHSCHCFTTIILDMQYVQKTKLAMKLAPTKVKYYKVKSMIENVIYSCDSHTFLRCLLRR